MVGKANQKVTFLSVGGRVQLNPGAPGFQPYASVAWNRAFDNRSAVVASRFLSGGPGFGVAGTALPKNSAEVEAGVEFTTGPVRLGAAYSGTLAAACSAPGGGTGPLTPFPLPPTHLGQAPGGRRSLNKQK